MNDKYLISPFLFCMLVFILSAIGLGIAFSSNSIYMDPIVSIVAIGSVIVIKEVAQRITQKNNIN